MSRGLRRRRLLATLGVTAVPGCVNPESCMPPGTDFEVSYEQAARDAEIVVTVTGRPSLSTDRIRMTIGETVVYDGGDIRDEYVAGANARDGWGEQASEGEQLTLSTAGPIPAFRRLSIDLLSSCDDWNQRVRSETPPPPMTVSATAERIDGRTYLTVTHERGTDFDAANISVFTPGEDGYLRGTVTEAGDGPAVIDEWSDGVSPGDRLRLVSTDPVGEPVIVAWYGTGKLEAIARATVQGDPSAPTETATQREASSGTPESSRSPSIVTPSHW